MSAADDDYEYYSRLAAENDLIPLVFCPLCHCGSTHTANLSIAVGEWGQVSCPRCNQDFLVAHAFDEMFVENSPWGYVFWLGCKRLTKYIRCGPGESRFLLLPNEFDEVYLVLTSYFGGMRSLAGGVLVEYTLPGMLVAAVASDGSDDLPVLHMSITLVGRAKGSSPPTTWKRLILEARVASRSIPALTPIHAVSAIDLFVEELIGQPLSDLRPANWNAAVKQVLGRSLRDLIGKRAFINLEQLVQIRNHIAHGSDYVDRLPAAKRAEERRWITNPKQFGGYAAIPPSAEHALRTALTVIRSCRRKAFELGRVI
jgi:hypothetical protein